MSLTIEYEVQELRRGTDEFIGHGNNPYSRVFALNLPKNQLTQLTEESLDNLYQFLRDECRVKPENCPIFFLYDRDYLSYKPNELRGKYIKKYTNPYSNENGDQGQLLLSYPSVESYLLSCVNTNVFQLHYYLGKDIKSDAANSGISTDVITHSGQIIQALTEMNKGLSAFEIDTYDLDDLGPVFLKVYDLQQNLMSSGKGFSALSLISLALLELGVIVEQ